MGIESEKVRHCLLSSASSPHSRDWSKITALHSNSLLNVIVIYTNAKF